MEVFERVQAIAEGALRGVFIFAGLEKEVFSKRLAYYFLEINALHVYRCALQGLGDTIIPMVSGIAEFVMRVSAAMLLPGLLGQEGIFYAEILAWTGACVILVGAYYRRMYLQKSRDLVHGNPV